METWEFDYFLLDHERLNDEIFRGQCSFKGYCPPSAVGKLLNFSHLNKRLEAIEILLMVHRLTMNRMMIIVQTGQIWAGMHNDLNTTSKVFDWLMELGKKEPVAPLVKIHRCLEIL